jgi:hypothetical protein
MRPAGTTRDAEVERHARLIALLARRPPIWKLQRGLDAVGDLWRPPDHHMFCLGGWVHWRVQPSADAVAVVAAHHASDRPDVRRAVLVALQHAAPHAREAANAVAAGLADGDALVRIHASRAAETLRLEEALREALTARLEDPVWAVRWHAARAIGRTAQRPHALAALLASQPKPAHRHFQAWVDCVETFADLTAARERLATLFSP